MTTATPGSAALLALAERIEREKYALDHMSDGQPEGLGPTEATFFDTMDENAAVIIAALRIAAKPDGDGMREGEWQPVTAEQMDGSEILGFWENSNVREICSWQTCSPYFGAWVDDAGNEIMTEPTLFVRLPPLSLATTEKPKS